MNYPTIKEVNNGNLTQVMFWNRRLPGPQNDDQVKVIEAVVARLKSLRESSSAEDWVTASKLESRSR